MVQQVKSGTVLTMNGRTFELVWTDETEGFNPCHHCALYKNLCNPRHGTTFVDLCSDMQEETNTYFVEKKQDSALPSHSDQELLLSILSEYQLICMQAGNSVRADEISKIMTQLTDGSSSDDVKKITLSVGRKNGRLILDNGKGTEWKMTGLDEKTAIASLVYFTIFSRFDQISCLSSDFKIDVSLCESIND